MAVTVERNQWRSDMVCNACSARLAVGAQTNPVCGREALLETSHTDPLQPCYATERMINYAI